MFALDTNIAIDLMRHKPATLARLVPANQHYLPVPVIGELVNGSFRSSQSVGEMAMIDQLIQAFPALNVDEHVARRYGQVKYLLELQGQRIPENDIWIAAVCLRFGVTLITRDQHFSRVVGLSVDMW